MGDARPLDPDAKRLPTIYDRRKTGFKIDIKTGLPTPTYTVYHIGHGQQLAARRLADVLAANQAAAAAR